MIERLNIIELRYNELSEELISGISCKIDDKNTLEFQQSYDLDSSRIHDQDYTWYRDIHCLKGSLTYRAKRDEIKLKISVKEW